MRICLTGLFPRQNSFTGSASVNAELASRLALAPGIALTGLSPRFAGESEIPAKFDLRFISTPHFRSKGFGDILVRCRFNRYVYGYLSAEAPDILHCDDNPALALARTHIPKVLFLHGSSKYRSSLLDALANPYSSFCTRLVDRYERLAIADPSVRRICVNSEFSKQKLVLDYNLKAEQAEKIVPFKLGYNILRFSLNSKERIRSRRLLRSHFDLRLADDAIVGLFIGGIAPHKGQYEMLKILRNAAERHPYFHMLFVGKDAGDETRCKRRALELGLGAHISFLGSLPDEMTGYCLSASDMYLSCATEGFGINQLEAMAAGLPIIALDRGAVRELFVDGTSGILARSHDDFFRALLAFFTRSVRRKFAIQARLHAEKNYSWDLFASKMQTLYASLARP